MQGKGIIKFFLVVLTLICLVQFLYVLPTNKVEKAADRYAESVAGEKPEAEKRTAFKDARVAYLDSMSSEVIFKIPLIKSYTYQELKNSQLNFGLDLKGGMSVLLQVDLEDFIRNLAGTGADQTLNEVLAKTSEKQKTSQSNYVNIFADTWKEMEPGRPLNSIFKRNEALSAQINASTSDGEVTRILRQKANETVDLTFKLLKERIDKLGVVSPNVSLDASRDVILVELPGVDNPQRARTFLQAAAKLEFWNVYRITDPGLQSAFIAANEKLKKMRDSGMTQTPSEPKATNDTTITDSDSSEVAELTTPVETVEDTTPSLDPTGTQQGPLFEVFTLNDGSLGLAPMGTADKNKRKLIMDMLTQPGVIDLFPKDVMLLWARKPSKSLDGKTQLDIYELYAIKKEPGKNTAPLEGDHVTDSHASPDPTTGELSISLKMDGEGARIWGSMTQKAATDNNREIAIVLDSAVVSAPRVINPILSGDSQITGSYTAQEAQDLANILQIGKLPARTQIVQESLVGPSLGSENISTSMNALLIGFLLALAFMIFYYAGAGIVAIIVLFLNIVFIIGAVASFGTVLTLPGIAGIVLTIGMAVDANIIIFERVKEELRDGKSLLTSIREGYKHSYAAILDGNITTFFTAVVLAIFGLGPIKGFAIVLMIGIASTLFTAVLVSRILTDWWTNTKGKNLTFWRPLTKDTLAHLNIDWMSKRKIFYTISIAFTIIGLISIFTRGFDLGVDFKGGYSMNIQFTEPIDAQAIREALATPFEAEPVVKAVDVENTFNVVTDYLVNDEAEDAPDRVMATLHDGLKSLIGNVTLEQFKDPDAGVSHVTTFSKVGPTIADDLRTSAFKSILFGLLAIFLYILIRFSKWQYSSGLIVATAHDTLAVISIFSLFHGILPFSMEVDQAFIAAILTIIGYSVNDTVIVFDRIREYFGIYPEKSDHEVINMAINSTMSRTLITSMTTVFTVLILWLVGSGSIKGFAFAMVVGIVIGTYSSIFIAPPVMSDISKGNIRITRKSDGKDKKSSFGKYSSTAKV